MDFKFFLVVIERTIIKLKEPLIQLGRQFSIVNLREKVGQMLQGSLTVLVLDSGNDCPRSQTHHTGLKFWLHTEGTSEWLGKTRFKSHQMDPIDNRIVSRDPSNDHEGQQGYSSINISSQLLASREILAPKPTRMVFCIGAVDSGFR
ncbi:hypothetical protein RRG08_064606 [Elysia crispata]|uniref:Uncharacterized protein n=1 Tax=Elysia crispata TaxID=231223 RepID=A0AAE1B9E9_9GAST|nr:hypothetical protein RRG08_064606 [Elysia crispata]